MLVECISFKIKLGLIVLYCNYISSFIFLYNFFLDKNNIQNRMMNQTNLLDVRESVERK